MKLENLLDMENLLRRIGEGMIRERAHPVHPTLRILGYTEAAQWSRTWDHETLTCRGLIYEASSGEVLARPYRKFFNHGEWGQDHLQAELDLSAPVQVTDKMDGSLGIIFRNPYTGTWEVATRGSFDSDQARLANDRFMPAIVGDPLRPRWEPKDGWTYLTEIIHPTNRIVLDYGDRQGLALLGAVAIETGEARGPELDPDWPDHRTEVFDCGTLADALAMPPRPNAEGLVVRYLGSDVMLKVKQEDYVRLHKIVTGLSDKAVWEHLASGQKITDMLEAVPDEFHEWVLGTAEGFVARMAAIKDKAYDDYNGIVAGLREQGLAMDGGRPDREYRKAFAQVAKGNERPGLMFQLLDDRDIDEAVWKELRPVGVRYMSESAREDVA